MLYITTAVHNRYAITEAFVDRLLDQTVKEVTLVLVDDGSGDTAVVIRTMQPTYRGALVVCQGGGQADVKLAVTEAVAVLTGLPADRITVAKWQ